jgi:hypothetical protein
MGRALLACCWAHFRATDDLEGWRWLASGGRRRRVCEASTRKGGDGAGEARHSGQGGELAVRVGEVAAPLGTSVTTRRRRGTGGCGSCETGERQQKIAQLVPLGVIIFFRWASCKYP